MSFLFLFLLLYLQISEVTLGTFLGTILELLRSSLAWGFAARSGSIFGAAAVLDTVQEQDQQANQAQIRAASKTDSQVSVRSKHWRVEASLTFNETSSARSATWGRKVHVDASVFLNYSLEKLQTFCFQKVEL